MASKMSHFFVEKIDATDIANDEKQYMRESKYALTARIHDTANTGHKARIIF